MPLTRNALHQMDEAPGSVEFSAENVQTPTVSIGIPVFNGSKTIGAALESLLNQTFRDFEIIISDNASTDDTLAICKAAALLDPRIRVICQHRNRGAIANFEAVLKAARARFFMFAAADDRVEPHFVEETLGILEGAPEAVACAPRTLLHFEDGRPPREARDTATIDGPAWLRPARFLTRPGSNSRFYGLYRTAVLRKAYLSNEHFHAFDWAVSALTVAEGPHMQSHSIILHRRVADKDKYYREHISDVSGFFDRIFPVYRMTVAILLRLRLVQIPSAIPVMLRLNLKKYSEYRRAADRERHKQ